MLSLFAGGCITIQASGLEFRVKESEYPCGVYFGPDNAGNMFELLREKTKAKSDLP